MFRRRGKKETVVEALASTGSRAGKALDDAKHALEDAKLRERVRKAAAHGLAARREARRRGPLQQLVRNRKLHFHVKEMTRHLEKATARVTKQAQRKRRRRRIVRSALIVAPAAAFAVPQSRNWILGRLNGAEADGRKRIEEEIDIDVPVSTAYNQWTQFEEFPLFMEGIDDVRQLDDTKLHWTASIGGVRADWDAKILEQVPDRRIVWTSTDGKDTRGTVTFESLAPERARIRLALAYTPEGLGEHAGSAAGLDAQRVRGDLDRFKQLIESRRVADGAWRGEVLDGTVVS